MFETHEASFATAIQNFGDNILYKVFNVSNHFRFFQTIQIAIFDPVRLIQLQPLKYYRSTTDNHYNRILLIRVSNPPGVSVCYKECDRESEL